MTLTIPCEAFVPPAGYEDEYRLVAQEARNLCGGLVTVTVIPKPRARTNNENSYLHVLLKRLSAMTGIEMEQVKEYVKSRAVAIGYPPKLDETGRPLRAESGDAMGKDSHLATVDECRLLIEACHIVASEMGFALEE